MKILMLNYEFPPVGGGGGVVSYELAKHYVALGHKVDVVTMGYRGVAAKEMIDGIQIYRVKCWRSREAICHPWEQLTYIISAKIFLRKLMKKNKYDINHTHFVIPTGVIALWLKKKYGLEYILTAHGNDVLFYDVRFTYLYPLLKRPWLKILKAARAVVTPSFFLQNFLQQNIINEIEQPVLDVIHNGVDKEKFPKLPKEKRILIVARLYPDKGVQDILDALHGMNLAGWSVDIVGEGAFRSFLEKKSQNLGLGSIVKFHGWMDNHGRELANLYGWSSIFISASYLESFGVVLLEAQAAGCYVLATNVGGHPEIVPNDHLFEPRNYGQLREKITNAMQLYGITPTALDQKFYWADIALQYEKLLMNKQSAKSA